MSAKPWWYSGDDAPSPSEPEAADTNPGAGDDPGSSGRDWTGLVLGAQRLVDWATERVMAPHAEHEDPRDHPDCVVCRTMTVLGDVGLRSPDAADDEWPAAADDTVEASASDEGAADTRPGVIQWIPIRGETTEP